jgi:uncharacterized protein YgiM (DUF1202 family)
MTTKFKFAASLACALLFFGCGKAQDAEQAIYRRGGVITESNTAVRISPLDFSGVVERLEKGQPVEVIERSAEKSRIARTVDYWYHIKLQSGITGWVYGQNLRLMDIKNHKQLDDIILEFKEYEASGFSKVVAGKWWSVNAFGDFTEHALELFEDNRYRSYYKGQDKNPIEGEFRVDFNKNDIVFPQGTTFKQNLKFAERGSSYILYTQSSEKEMSFRKIQEGTEETPDTRRQGEQEQGEPRQDKNDNQ